MNHLKKRTRRFALVNEYGVTRHPLLGGFYAKQSEPRVLAWDDKPEHGVKQPMPPRKSA